MGAADIWATKYPALNAPRYQDSVPCEEQKEVQMSSVNIIKSTLWESGPEIQGEVTYEMFFNESEIRLDVGFVPTLVITPSYEMTKATDREVAWWGAVMDNSIAKYRKEKSFPIKLVRPTGNPRIVRVETFAVTKQSLFDSPISPKIDPEEAFDRPNAGLDLRIDLNLEISSSSGKGEDQRIQLQQTSAAPVIDTTDDLKGTITARGENGSMEGKEKAFDNQQNTKWLDLSPKGSWIQYAYAAGVAGRLTGYTITSANDCPERDPADWQLLGSNDGGANWTTVDSRTGVAFNARFQKLAFTVSGAPTYKIYRLNVTKVLDLSSANSVQLSEIELLGQRVSG